MVKHFRKQQKTISAPTSTPPKKTQPYMGWCSKPWCNRGRMIYFEKPDKKKIRGARKKRLIQEEKEKYPLGRPMYKKVAPEHRSFIIPKDIERLMHFTPRNARRYLSRVRKKLKLPPREIVTLKGFCKATPWTEEEVIPYLM